MHRFYIPPALWNPDALTLTDAEAHHAADVLRIQPGDRVVVFNGEGTETTAEVLSVAKRSVSLKAIMTQKSPPLSCRITLGQAIPKGKNMDLIVQKATELGAAGIAPILSERTVVQLDASEISKKQEKWQGAVIEASKQCGQNWLPRVHKPASLKDFFESGERFDLMLIASLQPDALNPREVLAEVTAALGRKPASVLVLVGPEGDFTPAEISLAKSYGCRPITLGPIVLRTETAALYCLSILSYEMLS